MKDVRTHEEAYWVGQPAQVNAIKLKSGEVFIPDLFKAKLEFRGVNLFLEFQVEGRPKSVKIEDVASEDLSQISYNVPVVFRDAVTGAETENPEFGQTVDALIGQTGADAVIWFCRSGQRSTVGCSIWYCPFSLQNPAISNFEIEGASNGYGGFEGSDNDNRYNGLRGFPGRLEDAVSFKDRGLPVVIGKTPVDQFPVPAWADLMN